MPEKDPKEMIRFIPARPFNGHAPGAAFSCSRADAEAYQNFDPQIGWIQGEEPEWAKEIQAKWAAERRPQAAPEAPDEGKPPAPPTGETDELALAAHFDEHFKVPQLKEYAAEHEIDLAGAKNKGEIIERLVKAAQAPPENKMVPEAPVTK